jgi:hypothetical protein
VINTDWLHMLGAFPVIRPKETFQENTSFFEAAGNGKSAMTAARASSIAPDTRRAIVIGGRIWGHQTICSKR